MQLLKASFINHLGEKVSFGDDSGIYLNAHALRDYQHTAIIKGGRIRGWRRGGVIDKILPLAICAKTESDANDLKNKLFSVAEADILEKNLTTNTAGRLYVNGYYLDCYIYGQSFTKWNVSERFLLVDCNVKSETGLWKKRLNTLHFQSSGVSELPDDTQGASPIPGDTWVGGTKGYYYGYPYGYEKPTHEYEISNKTGSKLGWTATVYGSTSNIAFTLGGIRRVVNVSLAYGEKLEIKALQFEKTIYKVKADGTRENCFASQRFETDLFAPIGTGSQFVVWDGVLEFMLTPIVERSSPEWG